MKKKKLWKVHAWLGLYVGSMILLLSLSGSIIVFRDELDQLVNPELFKVSHSSNTISLDSVIEKVKGAYPNYTVYHVRLSGAQSVVEVKIKPEKKKAGKGKSSDLDVYVDPVTGDINGARAPETGIVDTVTKLHTNLLAGKVGRWIVGIFGLALLAMLIVGLMIYPSFMKKQSVTNIRWREGARKVSADWHKLLGLVSVPLNLVWAITGITLAMLPYFLEVTVGKPNETFAKAHAIERPISLGNLSYTEIVSAVKTNFPEGNIHTIRHARDEGFIEIKLDYQKPFLKSDASRVYIDVQKKELISQFDPRIASVATKLFFAQKPIHYGTFGGVWTKILYSLFGLSSGVLFITGFIVYRKRQTKKVAVAAF